MDALILSCSTGGGHNAAARAIKEEMTRRGHNAVMLDPYRLAGNDLDKKVANGYIKIAQKTPRLFGAIYGIGNGYRRLPIKSPRLCRKQTDVRQNERIFGEQSF